MEVSSEPTFPRSAGRGVRVDTLPDTVGCHVTPVGVGRHPSGERAGELAPAPENVLESGASWSWVGGR